MVSGFMGFGPYHYKYPSGREGHWVTVGLAANKTGISLYVCTKDASGFLPEQFKARLGKASVGKSCIRFKKISDLNLEVVREMLEKCNDADRMF